MFVNYPNCLAKPDFSGSEPFWSIGPRMWFSYITPLWRSYCCHRSRWRGHQPVHQRVDLLGNALSCSAATFWPTGAVAAAL